MVNEIKPNRGCVLKLFAIFMIISIAMPTFAKDGVYIRCQDDDKRKLERGKELQKIVSADQADREDWGNLTPQEMQELLKRDLVRRKRVAEIFAEGCFSTAADFAAAALVFQHGDTADHFFQTFLWAKRAVELGDLKQKRLMALGIDRYLVNLGHKQLFASQARKMNGDKCWCLNSVEKTFPEKKRVKYLRSYKDSLLWIDSMNKSENCPPAKECKDSLKATPSGFIPGFW